MVFFLFLLSYVYVCMCVSVCVPDPDRILHGKLFFSTTKTGFLSCCVLQPLGLDQPASR